MRDLVEAVDQYIDAHKRAQEAGEMEDMTKRYMVYQMAKHKKWRLYRRGFMIEVRPSDNPYLESVEEVEEL